MADVLIVGAGPVGLTMAAELGRHGTPCRIIDRLLAPLPYCRAIGVTPRTLEVWDDMGIVREMIDAGLWLEGLRSIIHGRPPSDALVDLSDLPYAHIGIPQYETERVLGRHLARIGIEVERGVSLTALTQNAETAAASLNHADGRSEDATFRYVIGCDGAHSAVRRAAGIAFEGDAFPMMFMLGDVHIAWGLPRGRSLRALRLVENGPPDMFIAIPLPEAGRYRVSMLAPAEPFAPQGADHGLQSELPGPSLEQLQAVADDLLPEPAVLSDLRWSSLFRISMRLAENYRRGRVFLAGDAAHIHPPTGGQGMNTGIQDAYNLAWKLALVEKGAAPSSLLDSYEAERRPVGAEVVARTRKASENYGRESGGKPDRLADTQLQISYRGTPWVCDRTGNMGSALPRAGDRAPDTGGLRRHGVGFPFRLLDCLRGTEHVLIARPNGPDGTEGLTDLTAFAAEMTMRYGSRARIIAITARNDLEDQLNVAVYRDVEGQFAKRYGTELTTLLVRPDGHIGWSGGSWRDADLIAHLDLIVNLAYPGPQPASTARCMCLSEAIHKFRCCSQGETAFQGGNIQKNHFVTILVAAVFLLALSQGRAQDAVSAPGSKIIGGKPEIIPSLAVLNSPSAKLDGSKLTLTGVGTNSIVFADRPFRAAGHVLTSEFIKQWDEGADSFAKDPPNATVSVFNKDGSAIEDAVVELRAPKLEGADLTFDVTVLEGGLTNADGPASLFIDWFVISGGRWHRPHWHGGWYGYPGGYGAGFAAGAALGAAAATRPPYYPYYPPSPCGYYPYPPCY